MYVYVAILNVLSKISHGLHTIYFKMEPKTQQYIYLGLSVISVFLGMVLAFPY